MTSLSFRNVDADPTGDVAGWPAEAIEIALDRGTVSDWHRLAVEIRRSPWGRVARTVDEIATWDEHPGVDVVMRRIIDDARSAVSAAGRQRWAAHIRALRSATGLSMRKFAALAGTSASRLSDYENARVAPTTDALARLEHAGRVAAQHDRDHP